MTVEKLVGAPSVRNRIETSVEDVNGNYKRVFRLFVRAPAQIYGTDYVNSWTIECTPDYSEVVSFVNKGPELAPVHNTTILFRENEPILERHYDPHPLPTQPKTTIRDYNPKHLLEDVISRQMVLALPDDEPAKGLLQRLFE